MFNICMGEYFNTRKFVKRQMFIGLLFLAIGAVITGYVIKSGSFYSKITFDRLTNSVYTKGLVSKTKIDDLSSILYVKVQADYKGIISSLCYNLEAQKAKNKKKALFPFCVSDSAKLKVIEKQTNSFLSDKDAVFASFSLFSLTNFIWFIMGISSALGGFYEFWRNLQKME